MDASFAELQVAILSSPGMGHLIPALVLGNRLAQHHNVNVTVFLVTAAAAAEGELERLKVHLHKQVQLVELPPVDVSHLVHPSASIVTRICVMVSSASFLFRSAIAAMEPRPNALIVDHFCTVMLPIAAEFDMAKYVYVPTTAWFTALTVYCPVLDGVIKGEYVDQKEPLQIPGCKPVQPEDVVDPMLDRNDQQYLEYLRIGREIVLFDGVLINSWKDLDPRTLHAFTHNDALKSVINIPVHPIGPLTRSVEADDDSNRELMAWLEQQPDESVVFVSFGSGGMLSQQQMTELAWGLELSRQRFVWVVRPPTTGRVDDAFFSQTNASLGEQSFLPEGFATRVMDRGLLVPNWAQQVRILTHRAIGGFLSHSGWNSTLESITRGVPMIAWPLYAEQKLNAAFLTEEVCVAVRAPAKQVVGREEIESMVRTLMERKEGRRLRENAKQLKRTAMEALQVGGSSHSSMCELLAKIAAIAHK